MNILVATDFSKPAEHAVELAAALAHRLGDQLVVAFAQEPPVVTSPDFAVDVDALERSLAQKAQASLDHLGARLREQGHAAELRLVRGVAADAIAKLGHELDARFIVVGTHGRNAVSRFFVGSVAERLVREADRPVLVARRHGDENLIAWAKGERPLHVAVALDMSNASAHGLAWVKRLRAATPCDLTFVHFYWPPEQLSRLGITTAEALDDADPTTVAVIRRDLEAFVGELPGQGRVDYEIAANWGELGGHLAFAASDLNADVLVLGTHQRRGLKRMWLGATLQPTLHAASVPVLCVPGAEPAPAEAIVPRLREVLVATDLSPLGNAAVPYAYSLVDDGGTVHLVHVHERHVPTPLSAPDTARGALAGSPREAELQKTLQSLVPAGVAGRHVKTEVHVIDGGRPPTIVLQVATRLGIDALVVASHGRTGLGRALMGSVTQAILEGSDKPVFVVRGKRG
ncbi:MAG: universal stress protein [Myxococcales bacterium]|nr:universal stress protein [Myxococcales bacterium]